MYFILGEENRIDFENECVYFDDDLFKCDEFICLNWFEIEFIEYREFDVFIMKILLELLGIRQYWYFIYLYLYCSI